MELHTLVPELSVTAQFAASDLAALHAAGYRSIICNRPDGEGADQPHYSEIERAEFVYAGKLAPSFPKWLIDGTRPSRVAWYLKERLLPPLYWKGMLKGREWLARPEMVG